MAEPPPAPRRMPAARQLPIDPDLPPDQPLEPGSGPADTARQSRGADRRVGSRPRWRPAGGPGVGTEQQIQFHCCRPPRRTGRRAGAAGACATHRRRFHGCGRGPTPRQRRAASLMKRVKSLFGAASIIAIVIGGVQIAAHFVDFGGPHDKLAQDIDAVPEKTTEKAPARPDRGAGDDCRRNRTGAGGAHRSGAANACDSPSAAGDTKSPRRCGSHAGLSSVALMPPRRERHDRRHHGAPRAPIYPGLVTGSISRPATPCSTRRRRSPMALSPARNGDRLPAAIGGVRLRSAATAGDAAAAYEVGVRFAEGRGVPADLGGSGALVRTRGGQGPGAGAVPLWQPAGKGPGREKRPRPGAPPLSRRRRRRQRQGHAQSRRALCRRRRRQAGLHRRRAMVPQGGRARHPRQPIQPRRSLRARAWASRSTWRSPTNGSRWPRARATRKRPKSATRSRAGSMRRRLPAHELAVKNFVAETAAGQRRQCHRPARRLGQCRTAAPVRTRSRAWPDP